MNMSAVRIIFAFFLAITCLPVPGMAHGPANSGQIQLIDPWARATPPSAANGAVFLEIHNAGTEPDWLIAADSLIAGKAGIHETAMTGGVMKMRPVDKVEIPAGGSVLLKPGGFHIMLMKLAAPLDEGDTVPVSLTFEKAGRLELVVPVAGFGATAPPHTH